VQDIKTLAENFTGTTVTITNDKAVSAMKIALSLIADKSGYEYEIVSAAYTGLTWHSNVLPENNLGVTEVNIDDKNNTIYSQWRRRGRDMWFVHSDNYVIHYKALPSMPIALTSELEVHPIYIDALWEFMISYSRLSKWEGKDEFGSALVTDFRNLIDVKWRSINKGKSGSAQWKVIR
jgi:hypothetical protein